MIEVIEAFKEDGVKHPRTQVEVVCFYCQDPVSAAEETSGTCTNCGQPWREKKSVSIWTTSVPKAGVKTLGQP